MSAVCSTILLLMQITVLLAALPPIQKCSLSDSGCLQKSAQNVLSVFTDGIPEVGSEILDPIQIDVIKINLSGLKLNIKDAEFKGLKKTVIDELSFNSAKKEMKFSYHVPIVVKGKYKAAGKLLILPISGDGDITIKVKSIEVFMTIPYNIVKNKKGKDTIELKNHTYHFENRVNTHFILTNLFNGNKELSDTMLKFINENWKMISQEFGRPVLDKPVQKVFTAIKAYLRSQAMEDIVNV